MKCRRALVCLALALLLSDCAQVAPWERGRLAKPQMDLAARSSLRAFRSHVYMSREAAPAGADSQGGGCGCY